MARTNGGIIGKRNLSSHGTDKITSKTSSAAVTTLAGTRVVQVAIVAGGGGAGGEDSGGGGAGGLRNLELPVCGSTPYQATIGGGGAGGNGGNATANSNGNPGPGLPATLDGIKSVYPSTTFCSGGGPSVGSPYGGGAAGGTQGATTGNPGVIIIAVPT